MESILTSLPAQLGIAAPFAAAQLWFLWYLLTKTIPGMMATFQVELRNERDSCDLRCRRLVRRWSAQHAELVAELKKLRGVTSPGRQGPPPADPDSGGPKE